MNNIIIAKEILRLAREIMALDHPDGTGKCDGEGTKTPFTGIPKKVNNDTKSEQPNTEQPNTEQPTETNPSVSDSPGQKLRNTVYDAIVNNKPFPKELKDKEDVIRKFVSDLTPNDTVKGFDSNKVVYILKPLVHNGELVINFGTVNGYFDCSRNELKLLTGCPTIVNGNFFCHGNLLKSLTGCPKIIKGCFDCHENSISVEEFKNNHPTTIDWYVVVNDDLVETAKQIYPKSIIKH